MACSGDDGLVAGSCRACLLAQLVLGSAQLVPFRSLITRLL